jgi:hypothetical protein
MSEKRDLFTAHYQLLQRDAAARRRLIEDPIAGLKEYFGAVPDGAYRIEVVPQDAGTITIMLPALPTDDDTTAQAAAAASHRVFDLLFTDGVGGYLIPDEALTWILRDMRSTWAATTAIKSGQ